MRVLIANESRAALRRYFFGSVATVLSCIVALVLFRLLYGDKVAVAPAALPPFPPFARGRGDEYDDKQFKGRPHIATYNTILVLSYLPLYLSVRLSVCLSR